MRLRRLLALLPLLAPVSGLAELRYFFKPVTSEKAAQVSLTIDQAGPEQVFRIPAWCPGYYQILNYQDSLSNIEAVDAAGKPLKVFPVDTRGWKVINPSQGKITFRYRVEGNDSGLGFFAVHVRSNGAYASGAGAFVYPEQRMNEPATLTLKLPKEWQVATAMSLGADGKYHARDYDEFIDHPIEMGSFERRKFTARGIPFEVVFVTSNGAPIRPNIDESVNVLKKISEAEIDLFQGQAPFKKYLFLLHLAVGNFSGGIEHQASTVIAMPNASEIDLVHLGSHELFHAWNVKNIRPKVLGPFDYSQPNRTGNLWFAEGVTEYYASRIEYKIDSKQGDSGAFQAFLRKMNMHASSVWRSQTRLEKTAEEVSKSAWESNGMGFGDMSFYSQGLLVGFLLDMEIRGRTQGAKSLDDVMRALYAKHHLPLPGYEEDAILRTLNEVTGQDFTALYQNLVQSKDPIQVTPAAWLGLKVEADATSCRFSIDPDAPQEAKKLLEDYMRR